MAGFESAHGRALLAYLAVECGQPHSRQQLAGMFWPDQEESKAHQRLSQALYNLRQVLGEQKKTGELAHSMEEGKTQPFLLITSELIQFNPQSDFWLDIQVFTELFKRIKGHNHRMTESCSECSECLSQAIQLYRGDFLEGFSLRNAPAFDEWSLVWCERLRLQAINALGRLTTYHDGYGEIEQAVEYARQQVSMDPLGDKAHRQLMRLLALNGESTAALVLYNNFRRQLEKEMGITPEHETHALYERLRLEAEAGVTSGNLPARITPLVGRRNELSELTTILRNPEFRLINLIGPGGSGKTHLALEASHAVRYHFADGVYLVSLSALESSQSILPVVAEAFRFSFRDHGEPQQQLKDYFRHKNILLVMDGFEAILPSAAWLSDMLQAAPQLKILVTSRARLNIMDEQLFALSGMDYPIESDLHKASSFGAVQLFEKGARRVKPDFSLQQRHLSDIVRICQQVQGMPLGILLASAWMDLFTPGEISAEIGKSLDFLSYTWNDMPERQRSLKATFDYSWNKLSEEEQGLLKMLSVFHSSFSIHAISSIAGRSMQLLQALVDKSLVNRIPDGRYQIHDLVHQFATERLEKDKEQARDAHTRHSNFYLQELEHWGNELKCSRQSETLVAMEQDVENLRLAWRWAVETQDWSGIAGGFVGMAWFADLRCRFQEGERACRTVLEQMPAQPYNQLFSALVSWQGHFLRRLEQAEHARQLLEGELGRLGALQGQGYDVCFERAQVYFELGELNLDANREKAREYYQQCLELFQMIGDDENTGKALLRLGEVVHHAGEYALAGELLTRALPLLQATGEPRRLASNLRWLGFTEIRQGRIDEGEPYIRQAIDLRKQIGDQSEAAQSQDDYATVLAWRGRYQEAIGMYQQCLPTYEYLGMHNKVAWVLAILALLNNSIHQYDQARQVGVRCIQLATSMSYPRELALGYASLGQADLGERKFDKALNYLIRALEVERSIPQSDELAYTLGFLALAELGVSQIEQAYRHLWEALEIICKTRGMFSAYICLPAAAVALAKKGDVENAIEVQALMSRYPAVDNAPMYEDLCWSYILQASARLPPDEERAAHERGYRRDLFATIGELIEIFSTN
jgi:predicted ATPase/DNA-binding SARP family transcriptional activator